MCVLGSQRSQSKSSPHLLNEVLKEQYILPSFQIRTLERHNLLKLGFFGSLFSVLSNLSQSM